MTPTQIEQLAREAGARTDQSGFIVTSGSTLVYGLRFTPSELTRFATLVRAAALEEAAALLMALHGQAADHSYYHHAANEVRALAQEKP